MILADGLGSDGGAGNFRMAVRGARVEDHPVTVGELVAGNVAGVGGGDEAGLDTGGVGTQQHGAFAQRRIDEWIDANGGVEVEQ